VTAEVVAMGTKAKIAEKAQIAGRVTGVDHVTIPVADMAVAERFYVGLLGAELIIRIDAEFIRTVSGGMPPERAAELNNPRNSPVHTSVRFGDAGPRVDLFLQDWGQPAWDQAHPHTAFGIAPGDMDRVRDALHAAGVPTDGPRRLGPPGQASLYFNDPFGNRLEFVTMGYERPVGVGAPDLAKLKYSWRG
jgi:catechol 2,3-dioxygenase-like lactoylglutathione lyase family enzyme